MLSGGVTPVGKALEDYQAAWKAFIVISHLEALEHVIEPVAISWKVAHTISLYANLRTIGDKAEQIHIGTADDRFIAMAVLRESFAGFRIIKILERRPTAHDALGLDSIDYRVADLKRTYELLKGAGARVEKAHNDAHTWLSLRFGKNHEYEAKFIDHSLLDIAVDELRAAKVRLSW